MLRVLKENTHPVFPSSLAASRVNAVGSREPVFVPGVYTDQHPSCRGLSPEGLLKLSAEHHTL